LDSNQQPSGFRDPSPAVRHGVIQAWGDHPPLQPAQLDPHPSEPQIVREALNEQKVRLGTQIRAAQPEQVVTLGDAAAQVIADMSDWSGSGKVSTTPYGLPRRITLAEVDLLWFALVHPAARGEWQRVHAAWIDDEGFSLSPQ
jgi:uracil-DNA glycosylase